MQTAPLALPDLIAPGHAALVVVDVQNDYCHPDGALGTGGAPTGAAMAMLPVLERLITAARAHRIPVVWLQTIHTDATDSEVWVGRNPNRASPVCRPDSWGIEFTHVAPAPGETVVVKHRYSGFINTRLDTVLRTLRIQTLIMTGVSTNVCVESTARHGFMLDYRIVMIGDCCAAYDPNEHDAALHNIERYFGTVASADEVIAAWN